MEIDDLKARVSISSVVGRVVTLKAIQGKKFKGLCPFHKEKTGSFEVDDEKGFFYCFGCGAKGDVIHFLQEYESLSFRDALDRLREIAGVTEEVVYNNPPPKPKKTKRDAPKPRKQLSEVERPTEDKQARLRRILAECDGSADWIGEAYLESRGLNPELPPSVFVHPSLWHSEAKRHFPAMIFPVYAGAPSSESLISMQRVYLAPDGRGKAPLMGKGIHKKTLGSYKGGACWLVNVFEFGFWPFIESADKKDDAKGDLWIVEGPETGCAVYQFLDEWEGGDRPWAVAIAISSSVLDALVIPPGIDRVILAADKDRNETGQKAANKAALVYQSQGFKTEIKLPPMEISEGKNGVDWLDAIAKIKKGRW